MNACNVATVIHQWKYVGLQLTGLPIKINFLVIYTGDSNVGINQIS